MSTFSALFRRRGQRRTALGYMRRYRRQIVLTLAGIVVSLAVILGIAAGFSWQAWVATAVTLTAFLGSALSKLPTELVFLGSLGSLLVSGILSQSEALSGFSNEGMLTVGILYIVVTGLQQTGSLAWISQRLLGLPSGLQPALVRMMLPVMTMSAFLNNTPVVAMFIPVVTEWSRKLRLSPSKLLMPLSYAAIFGGACTLIGTSTNLVVNGMLITQAEHDGLGFFSITRVSLPCAFLGIIYLLGISRWLPERKPPDFGDPRQYTVEMVVETHSPLAGQTIEQAGLRHLPGLYLSEIDRDGELIPAVSPKTVLREQDQLVFVGAITSVVDLQRFRGLRPATNQVFKLDGLRSQRILIEAVVSNSCPLVGKTIREGNFRTRYNAVVLAVSRNGERLSGKIGDIALLPGDMLLLEAQSDFVERQGNSRDFYLVSGVPDSEPLNYEKAPLALGILLGMVALASLTDLGMLKAATLAAILMVATQCCTAERALKSIEWSVLLVIAAALGIGRALDITGAAGGIAALFLGLAGQSPWVALVAVYALTSLMTEIITNNAAAALVFPIALSVANNLGVNVIPYAIAIMIAASASFSTPIGYQTNLMVSNPGGYRFSDFMIIGIPLNLMFGLIAIVLIPFMFPF